MGWLLRTTRVRLTMFAVAVTALALAVAPITADAAVEADSPAALAADWIAREYVAPDSEIKLFGTGILVDSLVSLAATGTQSGTALDMLEDLRTQAPDYVGTGETLNIGGAGKLIHVLHVYDEDVAAFVGWDLEAELRAAVQTSGDDEGRFGEASIFSQALAITGLSMSEAGVPAGAVEWLARAQCPSGEFTFDGTCSGLNDADTTGIAVLALLAGGDTETASLSVDWLADLQLENGSVPGYGTPNSNSTAAAAVAFVVAGRSAEAEAAATYLESMQFPASAGEADAGGLKWIESDTAANTFATVQGVWGMGVDALNLIQAPKYEFNDLGGSVFGEEIIWLAASVITKGCNPPANDSFCPTAELTRGEMAALLNRALELPGAAGPRFVDTSGSVFRSDIDAIAAADITRGCNPPANDRFCPDGTVTRGQMAAFLTRAFSLAPASRSDFTDLGDTEFAPEIEAIYAAGITKGCNPPQNDQFCPDDPVTREQMAAFIYRAMHS